MSHDSERFPSELAHILFMDIVGYSLLLINDQRRVVAMLQSLVRNAPEFQHAQAAGRVISSDTGDGLALVFFGDPTSPVYCAVEIARALREKPELQLRMGINSGLVSRTTDFNGHDKVTGSGINMAQRVMDCGNAGHILLSHDCAKIMRQFSEWANALHDLGEYQIKHDLTLRLYNLCMEQVGNPAPSQATPKSAPPANAPKNGNPPGTGGAAKQNAGMESGTESKTKTNSADGAEMAWIPAGTFQMGGNGEYDGKPVHSVTLSGFWMYKTPVTVAQFRTYDAANGSKYDWTKNKPDWGWLDEHPMVNVSWTEASAYAQWAGVVLPTEAQWEYAARGGFAGKNYPWGDDWDGSKCANSVKPNDLKGTKAVKSYAENGWGLYDMAGNVWQWCADWYDKAYYQTAAASQTDPRGASSGTFRVLRGGSWGGDSETYFRCADRDYYIPDDWNGIIGFRCCSPGL